MPFAYYFPPCPLFTFPETQEYDPRNGIGTINPANKTVPITSTEWPSAHEFRSVFENAGQQVEVDMGRLFRQFFLYPHSFAIRCGKFLSRSRQALQGSKSITGKFAMNPASWGTFDACRHPLRLQLAFASAVAVLLLAVANPATAAVLTATGTNWKITPSDPGGVPWNTDPAFNDSGWQNATETSTQPAPPTVARAIWSSGGQFGNEPVVWARHTFSISGTLTSAELTYGCDDDCTIWLNGVQVVLDNNGTANGGSVDVLAQLQQGSNLIAFTANDNVSFGLNHLAWIQIDGELVASGAGSGTEAIPTLSEWALLMLALLVGGYGMVRIRRLS
jgi:hypothetical protein